MKRLIALLTAFCLVASPALAGWTFITGGSSGGTLGRVTGATSPMVVTVSANVPVGSLIVVPFAIRGNEDITGCVDSAGNTYARAGAFHQGVSGGAGETIYYAYATTALTNGSSTISCTENAANAQNVMLPVAFSGAQSPTANNYDTNQFAGSSTGTSVGPLPATGTLGCNSTNGNLLVAYMVASNALTLTTESTGFTNQFTDGGNEASHLAWQVTSTNATVTYSPTLSQSASASWVGQITNFKAASCIAATGHNLLTLGVGD